MKLASRATSFLFPPDAGRWLQILRIGLGWEIIVFALSLRVDWNLLYGGSETGLVSRELFEGLASIESPLIPRLGWIVSLFRWAGFAEATALSFVWWALLTVGCLLVIGIYSRFAAITAWFLQLACAKSAGLLSYGADNFITIGLFYLMIAPLPDHWSLDRRLQERPGKDARLLGFFRRVLQIHLCLVYFFSGVTKCLGAGWWDGSNLWRALTIPPFDILAPATIAAGSFLVPAAGIFVCLLETSYPFLIWGKRTRRPVLCLICLLHLGIGLFMGMYLFAGIMLVLNLAAFGPGECHEF